MCIYIHIYIYIYIYIYIMLNNQYIGYSSIIYCVETETYVYARTSSNTCGSKFTFYFFMFPYVIVFFVEVIN